MQTLNIVEQSNVELKKKLVNEKHAQKSADLALEGAQRQVKDQRKLVREATDQLAASKEQKLRDQVKKAKAKVGKAKVDAEKEKDGAEQHGYDVGVAETEEALRAEVLAVCRAYYAQTWEEALNRAGIDASSELRRSENVFFPPAIRALGPAPNQKEAAPPVTKPAEDAQLQNLPLPNQ